MLVTLLKDLLLSEITQELGDEYPKEIVKRLVRNKIETDPPTFERLREHGDGSCKIPDNERCCARIWGNHRGGRCMTKRTKTEYCKKHQSIIDRDHTLPFGRYDNPKPLYNEMGNRLPWFEGDSFHELETLFEYQRRGLRDLIEKREIAPQRKI